MADLTQRAAEQVVAGVGAVTVMLFGLTPGLLFCGFVGAGLGVTLSKTPSKIATMWAFLFSMFFGAYAGAVIGARISGEVAVAQGRALILATVALTAQSLVAGRLAPLIDNIIDRVGKKP